MQDVAASAAVPALETFHEGKRGSRDVAPASGLSCEPPPRAAGEQGVP